MLFSDGRRNLTGLPPLRLKVPGRLLQTPTPRTILPLQGRPKSSHQNRRARRSFQPSAASHRSEASSPAHNCSSIHHRLWLRFVIFTHNVFGLFHTIVEALLSEQLL